MYSDYQHQIAAKHISIEKEILELKQSQKNIHKQLMKEQKRASKSQAKGHKSIENKKWPTVVSKAKATRAQKTSGKNKALINKARQSLSEELSQLYSPEVIKPKFFIDSNLESNKTILSINNASVGYAQNEIVLKDIGMTINSSDKIAIHGDNASGKSTLLRAILKDKCILREGDWQVPERNYIGYLDQHYSNLNPSLTIIDHLYEIRTDWNESEIRLHLNKFLFRKNEEVNRFIKHLSGGEKARLSLCLISAHVPKILILDEITNNLDVETKGHLVQVLKNYPGTMIIVSHEKAFLDAIRIDYYYIIENGEVEVRFDKP